MADQLVALGGVNPAVDAMGAFQEGQAAAANVASARLKQAEETATLLGSGALYALGGDINGEVDPVKYNEVLDGFESLGIPTEKYRSNPNYAKVFAQASVSYLDRIKMAQSDRDYDMAERKFEEDIRQFDESMSLNRDKLAADQEASNDQFATIYYGRDKDGNIVPLQATKAGGLVQPSMPEGITSVIPPGQIAEQKARGTTIGKGAGGAEVSLAGADEMLADIDKKITAIRDDPDLGVVLGTVDSRTPNLTERSQRVQTKLDQLQGIAFLQARQMLKGGGAITDFESNRAEAAYARLQQAQSESDFKAALDDFNEAVKMGVRKLKAQAQLGEDGSSDDDEYVIKEK